MIDGGWSREQMRKANLCGACETFDDYWRSSRKQRAMFRTQHTERCVRRGHSISHASSTQQSHLLHHALPKIQTTEKEEQRGLEDGGKTCVRIVAAPTGMSDACNHTRRLKTGRISRSNAERGVPTVLPAWEAYLNNSPQPIRFTAS